MVETHHRPSKAKEEVGGESLWDTRALKSMCTLGIQCPERTCTEKAWETLALSSA